MCTSCHAAAMVRVFLCQLLHTTTPSSYCCQLSWIPSDSGCCDQAQHIVWLVISNGTNQAKIRISETFAVLIFVVGESGTRKLASGTAKAERMSRITYKALCSSVMRKVASYPGHSQKQLLPLSALRLCLVRASVLTQHFNSLQLQQQLSKAHSLTCMCWWV